jgi:hypothetical protein
MAFSLNRVQGFGSRADLMAGREQDSGVGGGDSGGDNSGGSGYGGGNQGSDLDDEIPF